MTAPYLPQSGTISYNGYSLLGPRASVSLEEVPVRDSSDRYVTHTVMRFTVDAWVTADPLGESSQNGTDAGNHMATIRRYLEKDGGALEISGFGFGTITANTSSADRDVNFGPKTLHLRMRPIGVGCIVVVWVVEVAVKVCPNGGLSGVIGRLKEYSYNVRWSIKPNGCTVRTVEGYFEIFLNTGTVGGTDITTTADFYRDSVSVTTPFGFIRKKPQEYRLSENKRRLSFSVSDEEQESDNAYPDGIADIDFDHTVSTSNFGDGIAGATMKECSFSGHIDMAKPYPPSFGWSRVMLLMQERITNAVNQGRGVIIYSISITESVFKRRLSFSVNYWIMDGSIVTMLIDSGLFTDIQSTNYQSYKQSMSIAWGSRGLSKLTHEPSSDRLIDQCSSSSPIAISDNPSPDRIRGSLGVLLTQCPSKENSYLIWENFIDINGDANNINIQQMPRQPGIGSGAPSPRVFEVVDQVGPDRIANQNIQQQGAGGLKVQLVMRGRAYRVGFYPEVPKIATFMGQQAKFVQSLKYDSQTQVGSYGQCPIYARTWSYTFDVQFNTMTELNAALNAGLSAIVYDTADGKANKVIKN